MIDPDKVRARLADVVAAMKQATVWDLARPADDAFVDMGAFGMRKLAFVQWLRFVFVPSIEDRLAAGGPWPTTSSVAVQATREGDTDPVVASLVPALQAFDQLFESDPAQARAAYEASRAAFARGDHATAVVEIDRALALAPACDNAENFAGWILFNKPARTADELEQAIAHFRRAPAGVATANLGAALIAAGRTAEAIATAAAVPECAEARNWLGSHFLAVTPPSPDDLTRAVAELREAVRIKPKWGVAWQNLGRALDALGDAPQACRAYGEAITCGDAYDDTLARDRRVQLELALRTRGDAPPEPPDAARADSAAARIVLATAALPPLATGQTFFLRPTTRVPGGAVAFAGIATVVAERAMYHVIVRDDGGTRVAFVQTREDPVALRWTAADDPTRTAAWLAEWLAADGANVYTLTPLDTAIFLFDLLVREAPRRWRLAIRACRQATLAIEDVDADPMIVVRALAGGVIEVDLGGGARVQATSPAQLVPHAPAIVAGVRRAIAAGKPRAASDHGDRLVVPNRAFADALADALAIDLQARVRELEIAGDRAAASAIIIGDRPVVAVLGTSMLHVWLAPTRSWYVGIGDDASARRDEIVAAVRSVANGPVDPPTLLALAIRVADLLGTALGETWTFAIPGTPEPREIWLRGAQPQADAVGVFAASIHVDGVRQLDVHHLRDVDANAEALVAGVRDQRAAFARQVALEARMRVLAETLVTELGPRVGVELRVTEQPRAPRLVAKLADAASWRVTLVELTRDGDAIAAHAGARGEAGWDGHLEPDHLGPAIDVIAAAVVRLRTTLTLETLAQGAHYRVRAAFDKLAVGMVVRFEGLDEVDNHYGRLLFTDLATNREVAIEGDFSTPEHAPLADAYRYLEAV